MMRSLLVVGGMLLLAGCGHPTAAEGPSATENTENKADSSGTQLALADAPKEAGELPSDLRTRKTGSDWPRFLGPQGTSVSTEQGIVSPWPEKGLKIVWQRKFGEGYAMPSISRGRLFHFTRSDDNLRLDCLKSETGEPLWKFEYPTEYTDQFGYDGGPRCCPVIDGDRVYLHGPAGMLHCLRAVDGKVLWKVDTFKEYNVIQNFFGVGSTPAIEGNLLIVQVGGSPPGSDQVDFGDLRGNGTGVVAFDKFTGEEKYRLSDELASYSSPVLATIDNRRWCFVFARGGLLGFEPTQGKLDFRFAWRANKLESVNAANPVVVGNQVLISETYGPGSALLKVGPGQHKVVWDDQDKGRDKSLQCHWNTPVYHDGYLYGCSGRHTGNAELRCIDFKTGKVQWSQPKLGRTSLLLVDGHFICLGEYGNLHLLKVNPKKFDEVSMVVMKEEGGAQIPGFQAPPLFRYPCWAAPILSHGLLYVQGDGRLVCLELIPEKS